jgi:uncharacterized membrane protein YbhN (UPF0104 family)
VKLVTRLSISLILTAAFLAIFARSFDLGAAGRSLGAASPGLIALGVLANLLGHAIRVWRWRVLLTPIRGGIGLYGLTSATFLGTMISFLVPFRLGEIVRPVLLARRERLNAGATIATVAIERILDLSTILALFLVFLVSARGAVVMEGVGADPGEGGAAHFVRQGLVAAAGVALLALPVLGLLVFAPRRVVSLLHRLKQKVRIGSIGRITGLLEGFVAGLAVVRRGRYLGRACLLSILMWLVWDLSAFLGVRAFGLQLQFADILLLMVPLVVGIAVPTPAGVGPYEFLGQISLMDFWGVAAADAAATTIALHAIMIVPAIVLGLAFMWREGLGWAEVRGMGRRRSLSRPDAESSWKGDPT